MTLFKSPFQQKSFAEFTNFASVAKFALIAVLATIWLVEEYTWLAFALCMEVRTL